MHWEKNLALAIATSTCISAVNAAKLCKWTVLNSEGEIIDSGSCLNTEYMKHGDIHVEFENDCTPIIFGADRVAEKVTIKGEIEEVLGCE